MMDVPIEKKNYYKSFKFGLFTNCIMMMSIKSVVRAAHTLSEEVQVWSMRLIGMRHGVT